VRREQWREHRAALYERVGIAMPQSNLRMSYSRRDESPDRAKAAVPVAYLAARIQMKNKTCTPFHDSSMRDSRIINFS